MRISWLSGADVAPGIVHRNFTDMRTYCDYEDLPLFVLVSNSTWSAAAANPASPRPLTSALSVNIPFGHIESAVRKTKREGEGVHPDIATSREEGLTVAHVEALQKLISSTSDPTRRALLIEESKHLNGKGASTEKR